MATTQITLEIEATSVVGRASRIVVVGTAAVGPQGIQGPQGVQGNVGPQGTQGPQGDKGDKGDQGDQGPQGNVGPQGTQGPKGDKGDKGDQGDQGPQGNVGPQGTQGPMGPQGPQGDQGPQGNVGPQGTQGPMGPSGVISVNDPITNSGTSTSADLGLSLGNGLTTSAGALVADFGATSTTVAAGDRGLPTGGTTGQVLAKTSATDYATGWSDPSLVGGAARPLLKDGAYLDGTGLVLSGLTGNHANTPDSAALDITGDIDIRVRVALDDWTPSAAIGLLSKRGSSSTYAYELRVNTDGTLFLVTSPDGSAANSIGSASTVATGIADGSAKWVRATLDVDDGAGNRVYQYFTSDDGSTWTQLGTTITVVGTTSIFANTQALSVGSVQAGVAGLAAGKFYRAQILNGIGGTVAFDADFSTQTADALAFTESSTNAATVTINTTRYTYGIPGAGFTTVSTQAVAANTDYFEPLQLNNSAVVDLLAWEVTTAPSSTATVHGAIYRATGDLQPTGAPVATFGGVSVATSTTGVYTTQITPVTLTPGPYVLAFNSSQAFTARSARQEAALIHTLGANPVLLSTTNGRTNAAFPNPSAGWNARAASSVGRNTFAVIRWRPA